MGDKGTVFVGMSGGVDSSVAAYLLKREGYFVVGVFIKVWHPPFLRCHWEDERLDAMRVAAHLEIPFLTCDAEAEYKHDVADYFIEAYKRGETPNPDVMCNTHVKFGVFHRFAKAHGADFIATGHYARLKKVNGAVGLMCGIDHAKDQSYFLWNTPTDALMDTIFPLGELSKDAVRRIAKRAHIPTAEKRDSQGICFLGHVDIPEFLSHYIDLRPGDVVNEAGDVIGTHIGALVYTLGQRHGLQFKDSRTDPQYVSARDVQKNTITVRAQKPTTTGGARISLHSVRVFTTLTTDTTYDIETRYHGPKVKARLLSLFGTTATLAPIDQIETPASGQSLVIRDGDNILGGGVVSAQPSCQGE